MRYGQVPKSNLHTHTVFCDGACTVEEAVQSAISLGMDTLGFSGHSFTSFDPECSMSREGTLHYRNEVLSAKRKYADSLHILLGIEQDYYGDDLPSGFDYVIGSMHYFQMEGEYWSFDLSREETQMRVKRHFGGDYYALCRYYYEQMTDLVEKTGCDIVGHFDLVTKFNGNGSLFDETDPRYLRAALQTLDLLLEKDVVFEVNTGAFVKGYRRVPYPSLMLLRRIAEKGGRLTLSSDAHRTSDLLAGFSDVARILKSLGIGSVEQMTREGWKTCPI